MLRFGRAALARLKFLYRQKLSHATPASAVWPLVGTRSASSRPTTPVASTGALRVLLAEDNPVNQKLAQKAIEKMGHQIVVVNNGAEAVRAYAENSFDLVLMDLRMPEMDGFAATSAIRRTETDTATRTPIVAITAHALEGDRERCLAAGMDDYISKPIDLRPLARLINGVAPLSGERTS